MRKKAIIRAFILFLALLSLESGLICAGAASANGLKSIRLPSVVVVPKGKSATVKATLSPSGAQVELTWSSSDESVVRFKSDGVVTGVDMGEAYVYAAAEGKKAKCLVRVVKKLGFYKDGGKTYYCDPKTGILAKGMKKISGKQYYFDPDTREQKIGLTRISNGRTYNFLRKGGFSKGVTSINRKKYYFHKSKGYMLTGLRKISGKTYYFDPNSGVMARGLQTIKNKKYYFNRSTGAQQSGLIKADDGKIYNFLKKGDVSRGLTVVGSETYYFHETEGYRMGGLLTVNGKTYYFKQSNGAMQKGLQSINDKKYYFDPNTGEQLTGIIKAENGNTYHFLKEGDVSRGFVTVDGATYYFNETSGVMRTGLFRSDAGKYYFDENGRMQTGFRTVSGSRYYFDPNTGIAVTGLKTIDGDTYYFNPTEGTMQTKTQTINGLWYYFDEQTGKQRTGFITVGKGIYNFLKEGGVSKGWMEIGANRYYFDPASGSMRTGNQTIDGKPYYFEPTGELVTGVRLRPMKSGSFFFFFDPKEETGLRNGLQEYQGEHYLFHKDGYFAMSGYRSVGSKLYYFDPANDCKARQSTSWDYKGLVTMNADANGVITPVNNGSPRGKVLEWALKHLGASYGTGSGQYTCSSFSAGAYEYAGEAYMNNINPGAHVQALMSLQYCGKIARGYDNVLSQLQPGDLVFWDREDLDCDRKANNQICPSRFNFSDAAYHIHHVGIYFGDGQIVEAADETLGTLVQDFPEDSEAFFVVFGADLLSANIPDEPAVDYSLFPGIAGNAVDQERKASCDEDRQEPPTGTLAGELDEALPAFGQEDADLPILQADPVPEESAERDAKDALVLELSDD